VKLHSKMGFAKAGQNFATKEPKKKASSVPINVKREKGQERTHGRAMRGSITGADKETRDGKGNLNPAIWPLSSPRTGGGGTGQVDVMLTIKLQIGADLQETS